MVANKIVPDRIPAMVSLSVLTGEPGAFLQRPFVRASRLARMSSPVRAVGITRQAIPGGFVNLNVPRAQSNVAYRAAKCRVDRPVFVPRADAFLRVICAVIEIIWIFFVRFPKRDVIG